eukprot:jgi/Pico_ML_1/53080/g3694.t1
MPGPIGSAVRGIVRGVRGAKKKWKGRKDGPGDEEGVDGGEIDETTASEEKGPGEEDFLDKSKRWSYYAVLLMGFVLALDFTAALMSIQPYWYYIGGGGHENLYGLVFGSYDLTQMISAPILGYFVDRDMSRFKSAFVLAGVVNGCGNLLYAFTALIDHWWSMLVARLVSGLGAGALSLGAAYVTMVTTMEQRTARLGSYRVSQSLARQLGPMVGYIFIGLPALNQEGGNSTAREVFNWYTMPGWFTFIAVVVILAFFCFMFVNPSEENGHIVPKKVGKEMSKEVYAFFSFYLPLHFGLFYASTAVMGIGISTYYASSETFFSKKLTQYHCEGTIAKFIGLYAIVSAGSRFAGPLIAGGVTRIADSQGNVNTPDCNFTNGDQYVTDGCVLYNNIPFFSAMAGFTFLLIVCLAFVLLRFGSYGEADFLKGKVEEEESEELT